MRIWLRITPEDRKKLDIIADSMGLSRSGAIRFLIRQWMAGEKTIATMANRPAPP